MPTDVESEVVAVELRVRNQELHDAGLVCGGGDTEPRSSVVHRLKPVDRGRDAWTILIAGFIFEAFFWAHADLVILIQGFPMCFGVFQNYYSHLPEFQQDSDNIALIGVLAQGLPFLAAPVSTMLTKRFPRYHRHQIWIGWPMLILGLLAASFAQSVDALIGTQGVLYGVGFVTVTYPIVGMINEWFVARKGMAFGVISSASGATGAVMPFVIEALLARYGYRTTLRACAVAMTVLTAPLIPLFKDRLPASEQAVLARTDWSFLRKPLFWVFASAILIQGLGFFFPVVFLPSYASALGLPSMQGALLVALMCIAQVLGQLFFGYMSDRQSVSFLAVVCCVAASAAAFVFWGMGKSIAFLAAFSLVYGFFGFGFGTMRVAMGRAVSDDPATVFTIFSIYVFLMGVGNVLVGPISAALLSPSRGGLARSSYAAGKYEGTVVLTGASSLAAGLVLALWHGYDKVLRTK
ncbi:uncharacterized protein E0L32_009760 [Thyridium curvatum]|uniref:Major facilitator superfamily (MFS) profile domain-containing protein n=1 Tax=Thyridium curvatum TaxID=1093900 RepID=A0A507AX13_9PEZI|nr:uncharacterized protein E0L32_009760 [Thyridium curvatum]TPX08820.1 hypothetical protein E0L32_009760 [Thyridium curvatum]